MPKIDWKWVASELLSLAVVVAAATVSPWLALAVFLASEVQAINGYRLGRSGSIKLPSWVTAR